MRSPCPTCGRRECRAALADPSDWRRDSLPLVVFMVLSLLLVAGLVLL
jgi:hypothetical protein